MPSHLTSKELTSLSTRKRLQSYYIFLNYTRKKYILLDICLFFCILPIHIIEKDIRIGKVRPIVGNG